MKSAFNQIPLHFADRHKTAFSTPDGDKYEFKRLCFGLKNSPKAFQSIAQEVLGDLLHNGALVYIDDIILFTKTIDEHFELLGFLSNKNPSSKILRWKLALEEFNYDIHYIRGSLNSVADHLSRCINNFTIALPDSKDLINMQHEDSILSTYGRSPVPKLQLQFLHLPCSCCLQETEFGGMRLSYPTSEGKP
ncbi:integrase catalytic domain-containing protein [Trichonephila clavipes]|uniref:Integrase catalytic domain-containing protein n=1 Tax=Trichonephila clavipes TaxID=2585209 RepID=A0A8X6WDW3_TRICX|nr:integrase catalytic domain-containing protein [Trichonephila clavipes]